MSNCPYCREEINESFNFCVKCEKQVKCINKDCSSILIKDKSKCLCCGVPVQELQSSLVAPMNTFSLHEEQSEKGYLRDIQLSFTNEATSCVASGLNGYVPFTASTRHQKNISEEQQEQVISPPFQISEAETTHIPHDSSSNSQSSRDVGINNDVNINHHSNYFEQNKDGYLVSKTPDYKGKNKKLQQQRFCLLYVWAYPLYFDNPVSRENLSQAARNNGVYDKNFTSYLKDTAMRFFISHEDSFKLNPAGKAEINSILAEMQNEELKGTEYWNPKKRTSSSRTNQEDIQKIDQWIVRESRFDHQNFDIKKLNKAYEYAILALYDLTKELNVEQSIKSNCAVDYLMKRYTTISKTKKVIQDAFSSKSYSNYFCRTDNKTYYLTPEAEKLAESWLTDSSTN